MKTCKFPVEPVQDPHTAEIVGYAKDCGLKATHHVPGEAGEEFCETHADYLSRVRAWAEDLQPIDEAPASR